MIRLNFNDNWQVIKGNSDSRTAAFLGTEKKQIVHLPYDAMIHEERDPNTANGAQTGFYPGGEYIFQKTFEAPEEWKDKEVILEFEGVYQTALIYVNGALAKKNFYGYSNFYITLNPWLNYGTKNQIKVIADNSMEPNSRWYTGSGIYRDVKLLVGDRIHIPADGIRITTLSANEEFAIIEIETKIKSITRVRENVVVKVTLYQDGEIVGSDRQNVVMYPEAQEISRHSICISNPKLWDCDSPNLYECIVKIECQDKIIDETVEALGIRTLTLDSQHGLRINRKEVKLRGTCIHHDNGILGAATFEQAEERRCQQLKEAGFNSIRSAHHPISKAMLRACDRLGILVMDELSDIWTIRKNNYDFALHFTECWEQVVERMVEKDYNHPSVILYSVGNEISEIGTEAGAWINRKICNKFHELDHTRYTTNGVNGLMAAGYRLKEIMEDVAKKFGNLHNQTEGNQDGSNAFNSFMSLMAGEKGDYFSRHPLVTEALEGSASCDIMGLNYLTGRHVMEQEIHPNKTVIGTETYPADIIRLWKIVKQHHHVLGDFTWTGYDYLGEAGCGIFHYDENVNFSSVYPERTAYIGDIDLIGYRRPISYLREIVYGLRKQPYMAVERLNRYGMPHSKTPWMYKDNIASWTWPGYEGKPALVDIYADAEEVELFLNGRSMGRKFAGEENDFTATYEIIYEPGELKAVSYNQGIEEGCFQLYTAKEQVEIFADANRKCLKANGEDLSFITLRLVDVNKVDNLFVAKKIKVSVEGAGKLQAFGNANPQSQGRYDDIEWDTYDGYALAVVRASTKPGDIHVTIEAEGCQIQVIEIEVR